jgi:hypothetical protein
MEGKKDVPVSNGSNRGDEKRVGVCGGSIRECA